MAETFDVAGRLAEGLPAVDNIQTFVWACRLLGYQDPDLTAHAAQVREWYATEDGLNLSALEADTAALERAVAATQEALARQDEQVAALSEAWQGAGADASSEFLRRHGEASRTAAEAVRCAADALATLRDELWRQVDAKAAAAVSIDDRTQVQRAEWLAAAQTVMTGAGDRASASELVDQQVKPFVDNSVRGEWLPVMRSTQAAVERAYDAATAELTTRAEAVFAVPGGLGPTWAPPMAEDVATTPAAAGPVAVNAPPSVMDAAQPWSAPPAGTPAQPWSAPPAGGSAQPWSAPPAAPPTPAAPAVDQIPTPAASAVEPAAAPPAPAMPSPPSVGGLPDVGGGFSGFAQQLADMLGGPIGSDTDGLSDQPDLDDPPAPNLDEASDLDEPDDEQDDEAVDEESADETIDAEDADAEEAEGASDGCEGVPSEPASPAEPPAEQLADAVPTPVPEPPPTVAPPLAPPPPEPATAAGTPCEIAADEVPQIGQ